MTASAKMGSDSPTLTASIHKQSDDRLFTEVLLGFCGIVTLYALFYFCFGAYQLAAGLIGGSALAAATVHGLNRRGFGDQSRLLFVIICNLFVFLLSLGMGHDADAENYCIPTMMLGLFLFNSKRVIFISSIAGIAIVNWICVSWLGENIHPFNLSPIDFPLHAIARLNFLGSFAVAGSFFIIIVRKYNFQQENVVQLANDARVSIKDLRSKKDESQDKLQHLVESMQEGLVIINGRGDIIEINRVAREMYILRPIDHDKPNVSDFQGRFLTLCGSPVPLDDLPASICLNTGRAVQGRVLGFEREPGDLHWLRISSTLFSASADMSDTPLDERLFVTTFTDISDLIRSQGEQEEFWNLSQDFMTVTNMNGYFTRVNPSFVHCLGHSQEDYDAHEVLSFIHSDDVQIAIAAIEKIKAGEDQQEFVVRKRAKSGEYRRISWKLNGHAARGLIYATGRDITDEYNALQIASGVAEENKALANLLENTQVVARIASFFLDAKKGVMTWSKQMYTILDVDPSRPPLSTEEFIAIIHPDDRNRWQLEIDQYTDFANVIKLRFRCLLGERIVWIEAITQGRRDAEGEVETISGTLQDITERVVSEQQHAFVLEALGIGVWTCEPNAGKMEWDSGMYRIYDVPPEQFPNPYDAWVAATTPEEQAATWVDFSKAVDGEKDPDMNFEILTQKGVRKHIASRGVTFRNAQGQVNRLMGINWDRTKEIELERSLLAERVKMVNSAKMASLGEMSAGIAHEINNPLAIIIGKADKLERLVARANTTPEMMLPDFADIKKTAHRIAAIIKGLRTFSRNSENDAFLSTSADVLIAETLALCKERFSSKSVDLIVGECSGVDFEARSTQISQILLNLLNNAFDAVIGTENPWIKIEVMTRLDLDRIEFVVTDSGLGIPPEIAEKIMNPFFTTKEVGKGTGLGLSISQGMAQDHGGQIRLDTKSENTCFVLELPLHRKEKNVA